ncbi:MAG: hypothetical protein ACE5JI_09495 [Acidobacteriota bacterium]
MTSSFVGCGGSSSTGPSNTPPVLPPPPPSPSFQISTLITVYESAEAVAQWSQGHTTDERIGRILLGVQDLSTALGATVLNNEAGRFELQATIDRFRGDFQETDYVSAFDETGTRLERFLNDADGDGWSIDGRHGAGRDWPHDQDGNDPDGWTAQIVVMVTKIDG